jgi:hypothetical protein
MKHLSSPQSKSDFEAEGLAFGAGAMSETSSMNAPKQKRKTIFIKLHPKPSAPRSLAVMRRQAKFQGL